MSDWELVQIYCDEMGIIDENDLMIEVSGNKAEREYLITQLLQRMKPKYAKGGNVDFFNKMLDELDGLRDVYLEDGLSSRAAMLTAHKEIEKKYPNQYSDFEKWLDKGSEGFFGYAKGGGVDINELNIPVIRTQFEEEDFEFKEGGGINIVTYKGKKYKKQPNSKWLEISKHGLTKEEHSEKTNEFSKKPNAYKEYNFHMSNSNKLSNKEYIDKEIGFNKDKMTLGGGVKEIKTYRVTKENSNNDVVYTKDYENLNDALADSFIPHKQGGISLVKGYDKNDKFVKVFDRRSHWGHKKVSKYEGGGVKKLKRKKFLLYTNPNNVSNMAYVQVGDAIKTTMRKANAYPDSYTILYTGMGTNEDLEKAKAMFSNYRFTTGITIMKDGGSVKKGMKVFDPQDIVSDKGQWYEGLETSMIGLKIKFHDYNSKKTPFLKKNPSNMIAEYAGEIVGKWDADLEEGYIYYDKMKDGGNVVFSPVAVEKANIEELFEMAEEIGLKNYQNLNKEFLRKKILQKFNSEFKDGGKVEEVVKGKYYNIYDPGMDTSNDWEYISYTKGYHTFREEAPIGGGAEIKFTDEELKSYLKENLIKNSFKNGGKVTKQKVYVDLFEDYEKIPKKVQEIVDEYGANFGGDGSEMDYQDTANMLKDVEAVGYTFSYGLDNEPFGLRPIGVRLNQLKDYEDLDDDDYDEGGTTKGFEYTIGGL